MSAAFEAGKLAAPDPAAVGQASQKERARRRIATLVPAIKIHIAAQDRINEAAKKPKLEPKISIKFARKIRPDILEQFGAYRTTGARIAIDGKPLLVEPPPMLCDHLALVTLGVWTRSGASGVETTNEEEV